jgi:hypothetical protein
MSRFGNPRHSFSTSQSRVPPGGPKCPPGKVLKCKHDQGEGGPIVTCTCETILASPFPDGTKDSVSCPPGYTLDCSQLAPGKVFCRCINGAGDYTTPIITPSSSSRRLKARRRRTPGRYRKVAKLFGIK